MFSPKNSGDVPNAGFSCKSIIAQHRTIPLIVYMLPYGWLMD